MVTRRDFLRSIGARGLSGAEDASHKEKADAEESGVFTKLGFQLFTAPQFFAADLRHGFELLQKMRYDEIEVVGPFDFTVAAEKKNWQSVASMLSLPEELGYFGMQPAEFRSLLDEYDLEAPCAHVDLNTLRTHLPDVIYAAQMVGHQYVICPFLPADERTSIDDYRKLADEFNGIGRQCRDAGLKFAYHNHCFEFGKLQGEVPYEVLVEETDHRFVDFELDLFWAVISGANPVALFELYPQRFPIWHVKDLVRETTLEDPTGALDSPEELKAVFDLMADAGSGVIDLPAIFAHAQRAGLVHCFVERDLSPDPLRSMDIGAGYLSQFRKSI